MIVLVDFAGMISAKARVATMTKTMRMVSGTFLAATVVLGGFGGSTQASEPANDSFSFSSSQLAGDYEILAGTSGNYIPGTLIGSLSSSADVDYVVVSCANRSNAHMDDIQLGGAPWGGALPGDFDIRVYDPDTGNQIASGTAGGTAAEVVNMSAGPAYRRGQDLLVLGSHRELPAPGGLFVSGA
jgi:hypothetical protein